MAYVLVSGLIERAYVGVYVFYVIACMRSLACGAMHIHLRSMYVALTAVFKIIFLVFYGMILFKDLVLVRKSYESSCVRI